MARLSTLTEPKAGTASAAKSETQHFFQPPLSTSVLLYSVSAIDCICLLGVLYFFFLAVSQSITINKPTLSEKGFRAQLIWVDLNFDTFAYISGRLQMACCLIRVGHMIACCSIGLRSGDGRIHLSTVNSL